MTSWFGFLLYTPPLMLATFTPHPTIPSECISQESLVLSHTDMKISRLRSLRSHSSQYLPVAPLPPSTVSSRDSSRDNSKRGKDQRSRNSDSFPNPKRRSTMNSRDAAYDEEEQLRRAIEESKEDNKTTDGEESASRRPKRSRSDSEAYAKPWCGCVMRSTTLANMYLIQTPAGNKTTADQFTFP